MEDLISVIVPVYNVEQYLPKCIDTIVNQTYQNLEIILIDDGSTDNSGKMCDEYLSNDNRIKVIHKENGGLSDARNIGLNIATGKYITFVDSDDYIDKNYVEILYNLLVKNDADISVGRNYREYPEKTVNMGINKEMLLTNEEALEKLLYEDDFDTSAWAKLYKKDLFNDIRFPKNRIYEDMATTYKLIDKASKIYLGSYPIYHYIVRGSSLSNQNYTEKNWDLILSNEEMSKYILKKYPDLTNAVKRRMVKSYLYVLIALICFEKKPTEDYYKLIKYVKENRKEVLKDKKVSKKDRIYIYLSYIGFYGQKIFWKTYKFATRKSKLYN